MSSRGAPTPPRVTARLIRQVFARQQLHVLPHRPLVRRAAQARGRVVGDDELGALITVDLAAEIANRSLDPDQQLGRELAEAADDARLDRVELAAEIRR